MTEHENCKSTKQIYVISNYDILSYHSSQFLYINSFFKYIGM